MADAVCGPSNALQNFKRHTQVDRSIQQDRLIGPRTPLQGFRSHDPRAGSLDTEFHAFENAAPNPFHEQFLSNTFAAPPRLQQPASSSWASDFQQLSVSETPLSAQPFRSFAPLVESTNGAWHNEYMRQQNEPASIAQGKQAIYNQQNTSLYSPVMQHSGSFAQMNPFAPQTDAQQLANSIQTDATDQITGADWSQAFEEAFQDAFQDAEQTQQVNTVQEASILHEDGIYTNDHSADIQQTEQVRIGSDAIDYTEMKDRTSDQANQDASALARVAGELLHNVQHDNSEKFQNSQFLDLMRKIRDRQIEVRNNDFEDISVGTGQNATLPMESTAQVIDQDTRTLADPIQSDEHFSFPNMNAVYAPHEADAIDYTFESDQFPSQPRNQISELHPGGRLYPEQSPAGAYAQMSGAVSANNSNERPSGLISVADFEAGYDENRDLAKRFQRPAA